jgi:hypothetical protein
MQLADRQRPLRIIKWKNGVKVSNARIFYIFFYFLDFLALGRFTTISCSADEVPARSIALRGCKFPTAVLIYCYGLV